MRKYKTILDVIKHKTVEVGECMEWTGYVNGRTPFTSIDGRGIPVRALVALRLGMKTGGKIVTNCCNNVLCVNPDHIKLMGKSQFHSQMGKTRIDQQAIARRMKISAAVRKRAKLTPEIVAKIRLERGTQEEIGKIYGVCKRTIGNIQRGETWRDYGMFSQLWSTR